MLQDERFDRSVDELTGYRTKSVMCLPITHSDGRIIGVAQAINKGGNSPDFTYKDHQVCQYKLYNKELRETTFPIYKILLEQILICYGCIKNNFRDAERCRYPKDTKSCYVAEVYLSKYWRQSRQASLYPEKF